MWVQNGEFKILLIAQKLHETARDHFTERNLDSYLEFFETLQYILTGIQFLWVYVLL